MWNAKMLEMEIFLRQKMACLRLRVRHVRAAFKKDSLRAIKSYWKMERRRYKRHSVGHRSGKENAWCEKFDEEVAGDFWDLAICRSLYGGPDAASPRPPARA